MIDPKIDESVDFLKKWKPEGPWFLTAIGVNKKGIETRTFHSSDECVMKSWLANHGGKRNIYFQVNPAMHDLSKKAKREDIKEMVSLHLDIDPRAGENLEEERQRCLNLLLNPPQGVPKPTAVIFSGGGYQAFWYLQQAIEINGDLALAEEAKRYNQQLEVLFGADNCHNIDRLMRIPGSINIPDVKKKKKGRTPTLARLEWFDEEAVYPLSEFTPAPAVQSAADLGFSSSQTVEISGNIERVGDVEELNEWNVPDRIKVIIVQGRHPEEGRKEKDDSRSAWLFDCLCGLVRAGVPDNTIFAIITDPDYSISESVLDKGSNAEKCAVRQIERAKEYAIDPWLQKLNERHAVIRNLGGKCRVVEEVMDHTLGRSRLTRQSFEDIRNSYMHIPIQVTVDKNGNPVNKALGKWWLEHPNRRQFDSLVFAPGRDVPGSYNLWKGFACEAKPGDCSLFLQHVKDNICAGNEEYYEYLIGWMANAVQSPDSPGHVAIVLRGKRGTGKGVFTKTFGGLWGRHFLQVSDPKHLVGSFNAHLRDCVVLFGDEAFFAGDKKHESVLKTLITEETLTIEAKGVDAEASPNYVHLILASNDEWVIPAGEDERRYFVLDVGELNKQDHQYFEDINRQMNDEGGREALLDMLLKQDLGHFNVRKCPDTKALQEQKLLSLNPIKQAFMRILELGVTPDAEQWKQEVGPEFISVQGFIECLGSQYGLANRSIETKVGTFLKEYSVIDARSGKPRKERVTLSVQDRQLCQSTKSSRYLYQLRPLPELRQSWADVAPELIDNGQQWQFGENAIMVEPF